MTLSIRQDELSQGLPGMAYADLSPIQTSVVDLMISEAPSGVSPILQVDDRTFWERLANTVADVGGSWSFIGAFSCILLGWATVNLVLGRFTGAFDLYPFIFLNLVLSAVAALQAPVIMMSQKRQAIRDRLAAEHDYTVNLPAELEIMRLHDRLKLNQGQIARIETAMAALAKA